MRRHIQHKLAKAGLKFKKFCPLNVDNLTDLVASSKSFREVLKRLTPEDYTDSGSLHRKLQTLIARQGIDISHFTGHPWNKGRKMPMTQERSERLRSSYLTSNSSIGSSKIRKFVVEAGLLPNCCADCGISGDWNGRPITLHLDHIDGNHTNNQLENLRILCPNCHSQTITYCNKIREQAHPLPKFQEVACLRLRIHAPTIKHTRKAKKLRPTKIQWPSNEELAELVTVYPLYVLGPKLGVSDNAVKKRCLTRGIAVPDHRKAQIVTG